MKKATEVLGLKVMGVKEGRDKGVIQDIVINAAKKSVEYLILKDSRGYGFYALAFKDVLGAGADYAVTASIENVKKLYESKELLEATEKGFYILGATVLSNTGDIIGEVADFCFSMKSGQLEKVILDNSTEFTFAQIETLAGSTVFIRLDDAHFEAATEDPKLSAIEGESIKFLLGKTVKSRTESEDGKFVVEESTVLTQSILDEAVKHDAILLLTLNV